MTEARTDSAPLTPLAIGLIAGILAAAFEAVAVGTAMPAAARDLDGVAWYGWAFSLYMVGMLVGNALAGRLADRRGPMSPLVTGMAIFAAGLLAAGLAPSMAVLLVGRFVQGCGAGSMNVGLYVVIARGFPAERQPVMMTAVSAAWILPAFVGPVAAAKITELFSWHWVFLGILPLVALAAALSVPPLLALKRRLTPSGGDDPVALWVGPVLGLAAVALQYAGQRASERPDVVALGAALTGLVLLSVVVPRLMPAGFVTVRRGLPAVMATRALAAGAFFAAESFLPLMLVETRGLSLSRAGLVLTVGSVGWFAGSWLQSRSWLGVGRHVLISAGAGFAAVGIAGGLIGSLLTGLPAYVVWGLWILAGLGMGLLIASTGLATMGLSAESEQGRNASALQSGESLGNSIVTGLAGTVFATLRAGGADWGHTFTGVFAALVIIAVAATVASLRIGPVRDRA